MKKAWAQLEFTWTSWLRRPKAEAPPVVQAEAKGQDSLLTEWCRDEAAKLRLKKLSVAVRVHWNSRMRSTAGRASWPECLIELNPRLKDFGEDELWTTLRHELAHLVAYARARRRRIAAHGPEWRQACVDLGIPNERAYHNLPLPSRRMKRKHLYVCRHCKMEWWRVRPFRRAVACYDCCRKYNGGEYDERYRMEKKRLAGPESR